MSTNFQTSANDEQKKAIFHEGGVLLSAGAGSGKTFVLVEHIAFLIFNFRQKNTDLDNENFEKELKIYLSQIVLMTFTKKAAGELAIRLKKKMVALSESATDASSKWLWDIAIPCLDSMTVGTIDGFCYKLISQGFFPGLPQDISIISELESQVKVKTIFDEWMIETFGSNLDAVNEVDSFFINHKKEFIQSFVKIFSTPELRVLWKSMTVEKMLGFDWNDFVEIIFGEDQPVKLSQNVPSAPAKAKGAWVEKLNLMTSFFQTLNSWDMKSIIEVDKFFKTNKGVTTGPRSDDEIKQYFSLAKNVKDILDKIGPELEAFEIEGKEILRPQIKRMLEIFDWIEDRYSQLPGFTFSDLEYYVAQGLINKEAQENITNRYRYLIVDEFQDTSRIQYEIIEKIISKDFTRLFCVGDEKQAIYGFRGGELKVFQDCKNAMPLKLSLSNNYRSLGYVIDFNNALFKDLFGLGEEYEGHDPFPVDFELQNCPLEEKIKKGQIQKISAEIQVEEKQKVNESSFVEQETTEILNLISASIEQNETEEICVLYKGLKPSVGLMTGIISKGFGLRAQVKIPYPEDPMVALFAALVEGCLLAKQANVPITDTPTKFFISHIVQYLHGRLEVFDSHLVHFYENSLSLGLIPSFGTFLYELGLANSNHPGNMAEIERICSLGYNDYEKILIYLNDLKSKKYSIEFQSSGTGKVVIMTAHASKGLQFSHVILGGIHNNGRRISDSDLVGKLPGSLRWRSSVDQKKKFRSPQMLIEEKINILKDFSESKRLFYVACTRAESKISWIDIKDSNGKDCSYSKNSWIHGLRTFENNHNNITKNIDLFEHLKANNKIYQVHSSLDDSIFTETALPTFHLDPLGISAYQQELSQTLVTFPELSVTKLATISQCTRKFYLKHICKIEEDIEVDYKDYIEQVEEDSDELKVTPLSSSAERGTLVHESIAYGIDHKGLVSLNLQKQLDKRSSEAVEWAIKKVQSEYEHFDWVSEKLIKFDFFGQMISGTPDLVLIPKNKQDEFVIVDFKTGRSNPTKEVPYWFQLKAYAHAINSTQSQSAFSKVRLELWFVDDKEVKSESFTLKEINQFLDLSWSKLSSPSTVNTEHCSKCSFGKICHPNSTAVAPI